MNKYDSYKESGLDWVDAIPSHWESKKIKHLVLQENSVFIDGDWIESKVIVEAGIRYITTGNVKRGYYSEQGNGFITQETFDQLNCTEVFEGDLLISRLNHPIGRACIVPNLYSRIVTSVDNVILRTDNGINKYFLKFLFTSENYFAHTDLIARGATMQRISRGALGNIKLPIPPLDEQTAIANYLDQKTTEIDNLITKKERLIKLLEEEKAAVINQAVTKGLNPDTPMKDSSVEWLGEIPKHWCVTALSKIITVKDGTHESPVSVEPSSDTYPLITSKDFHNGKIIFSGAKHIRAKDHCQIIKRSNTQTGDIIMSMIGGNIGNMVLVDTDKAFSIKNVCLFKTNGQPIIAKHLYYILKSPLLQIQIDLSSRGGAQGFLSLSDLRALKYFILPKSELEEIVSFLDEETRRIEDKKKLFEKEISYLKEYKTALISNVVTGKIDVRDEVLVK